MSVFVTVGRLGIFWLACVLAAGRAFGVSLPDEVRVRMWRLPSSPTVSVSFLSEESWLIKSSSPDEFTIDSHLTLDARHGDCVEVKLRFKVDVNMYLLPELVCLDEKNAELPSPLQFQQGSRWMTTNWQEWIRVFPTRPETRRVRLRLHGRGAGEAFVEQVTFRKVKPDPYETGSLITSPHPERRRGLVLESNFHVANERELVTDDDAPNDGKWAYVVQDLDELTKPTVERTDWRSGFEDNPNVVFWSDGATLKSDMIRESRAPNVETALHFVAKVRPGPYSVFVNDPGRSVAVSINGRDWKRFDGGYEIKLGELPLVDGRLELWIDACYRDPISVGPAYFDYVRLIPAMRAESVNELFEAARRKPRHDPAAEVDLRDVAVSVDVPPSAPGERWPVRCGLPIPRGELMDAQSATMLSSDGNAIPSQNRSMATWPDGSVKWLYLDFMHDIRRTNTGKYTVQYGRDVRARASDAAVAITPTDAGLEVDTGELKFLVPDKKFGVITDVRLHGKRVQHGSLASRIIEVDGATLNAAELDVERVFVEQAGPLHAIIVAETRLAPSGQPASGFYHRARIHAYAGSPLIEIDYFVANTDSRPAGPIEGSMSSKIDIRSFELVFRPTSTVQSVSHAYGEEQQAGKLVQTSAEEVLRSGGVAAELLDRPIGWLAAKLTHGATVYIGVSGFREQFPKALRWQADALQLSLWAEEGGNFEWIEGVGKTHHVSLFFDDRAPSDGWIVATEPLLALAEPDWYCASGAFGRQIPAADSGLSALEAAMGEHMRKEVVDGVGLGFENYGDHSSGGYVKGTSLWDNNEYDTPAASMIHFVRTGDTAALRLGLASALHYLDVDTIHYSSRHADWQRAQHVHSHGRFGHHTAQGPDFHHAGYVQGLIWYDYFLGDSVGVAGAQGIADWVLGAIYPAVGSMERAVAHPLMTLCDVYEATGEEKYLRGAAQFVDFALKWEHPVRSGWLAPITEWPAYYSGSPFCSGLLPTGLIKFNSWAESPEIDAMLTRVAQWTLTDVYREPCMIVDKGGSPRRSGSEWNIATHGRLMAYAFERTGDPLYLVVPNEMTARITHCNVGTRTTGRIFNHLPPFLAALSELEFPQSDDQLQIVFSRTKMGLGRGERGQLRATITNAGGEPVRDFRMSFHSRQDISIAPRLVKIDDLPVGGVETVEFEVDAPQHLNLTCQYNRLAYGHCSAIYRRGGTALVTHVPVQIRFEETK